MKEFFLNLNMVMLVVLEELLDWVEKVIIS
jgi:hypothetical protein